MIRLFGISIFLFLILSCKKEYEPKDFRTELRLNLMRLSKEKALPISDTIARNCLEKNATKEELIKLMNSKNPILRVISYQTIVKRGEPDYFDLLLGYLSDTAKVSWWYYEDVVGSFTVSDLMIRKAYDQNGLSPIQKKVLVQNVLLKHLYLDVSNWMINDIDPDEKYYNLIKNRAKIKHENCEEQLIACYALSKFKKKEDIEFLYNIFKVSFDGNCLELIFKSIEKYPAKNFFPILKSYFEKNINNKLNSENNISDEVLYFTRAVASYKNKPALEILNYIEKNNTYINKPYWPPSNKEYVLKATIIHYDKIYEDLIEKIKKELDECSQKQFSLLKNLDDKKKDW